MEDIVENGGQIRQVNVQIKKKKKKKKEFLKALQLWRHLFLKSKISHNLNPEVEDRLSVYVYLFNL